VFDGRRRNVNRRVFFVVIFIWRARYLRRLSVLIRNLASVGTRVLQEPQIIQNVLPFRKIAFRLSLVPFCLLQLGLEMGQGLVVKIRVKISSRVMFSDLAK